MAISDDGEDGLSSSQRSSSSVGGTALLGAANGAAGAAMLGMSGTKLGYVVASAAAGLPLAIIGTIVVTGVTACAGQICYKLCCDSQGNLSGMDGQGRSTPILTPGRQRATVSATSALLAVQHDAVVTFPQHPKGLN
ncbi:MAG: hypothetical protein ACD_42C00136G0007 [uncultured bacterium]|nr:MAG: hypothetical protein ACD_42C00136G0007 [uncultured bacterium]OGT34204.1 MAG: hypothetical protein A3C44_03135 [Gammaproteobacteria bacterium RIFCSPHIGHO2_02_FULL_39_13]OGT50336.1 MAG: hypothetical protein A3E53_01125 [Gammaproteobacteria bacterium RIFCSPHIGHO2_12_FULL_39_24]